MDAIDLKYPIKKWVDRESTISITIRESEASLPILYIVLGPSIIWGGEDR